MNSAKIATRGPWEQVGMTQGKIQIDILDGGYQVLDHIFGDFVGV